MQKAQKHKPETLEKLKLSAIKRDNTKRIESLPKGKEHWRWSQTPTKLALHKRIHRKHGKASDQKCIDCGKQAKDWSNISGNYTDDIKDYVPRCRKCHIKHDGNNRNGIEVWKQLPRNPNGTFNKKSI